MNDEIQFTRIVLADSTEDKTRSMISQELEYITKGKLHELSESIDN